MPARRQKSTRDEEEDEEEIARADLEEIANSPCRHLETCVQWMDDAGRRWIGTGVENDVAAAAMGGRRPEANILQRRVEDAIRWCKTQGIPCRLILLKGRRSGSSMIWAKVVDLECRNEKTKALVMADVFKRSDEIFEMISNFAETDVFPWTAKDWTQEVVPGEGVKVTARSLEYPNGSIVIKETARDPNAGRGGGYRLVWFSEAAHFPTEGVLDANRLMLATLNAVPKVAGTIIGLESTACGRAGFYYKRWGLARWPVYDDYWRKWDDVQGEGDPEEVWIRIFASWFEIPRNTMAVGIEEHGRIMARLSKAEKEGHERYGWTAEQIKWRRFTIQNDFNGDENKFAQEYPSDPESAFLLTGAPCFNRDSLATLRLAAAKAQWRYGTLDAPGADVDEVLMGRGMREKGIVFRGTPREEAWCAILEEPRDGCKYLLSADVASMAEIAKDTGELDSTSILVLRAGHWFEPPGDQPKIWIKPRVVARILPEILATHPPENVVFYAQALLARYYGNPQYVIEKEKGEWLILGAKMAKLNLWRHRVLDRATQKVSETLGFSTNEESRNTLIVRLQGLIHGKEREREDGGRHWEPDIDVECPHICGQLETFVRSPKGRYEAASGVRDDDVLALGIGVMCIEAATTYRVRARRRPDVF